MKLTEFTMEPSSGATPKVLVLSPEAGPEPAVPQDAPVQEILFKPPSLEKSKKASAADSIALSFVMSDPHIAIRMRQTVRDIYAQYGSAGLDSLYANLVSNGPYPFGPLPGGSHAQLVKQFSLEREALKGLLESTRIALAGSATAVAIKQLKKSQAQVLQETKRYLGFNVNDDRTAIAALESGVVELPLRGSDILLLAKALLRLDDARLPIRKAEAQYDQIEKPLRKRRAVLIEQRLEGLQGKGMSEVIPQLAIVQIAEEAKTAIPDTPEVIQARTVIAEKQAEFFTLVATQAISFPILYRLWGSYPTAQAVRLLLAGAGNDRQITEALGKSAEFRRAVFASLRVTWGASKRVRGRLEGNELNVWRYPPLVTAALSRLAVPLGTVEWAAANERIEQEGEAISWVSSLSTAAGFFEMGIALGGAAPPVAAAAAVISLLLQSAEWVLSIWEMLEDRDAFNSSLNPADSFASEPSYIGVLVGLAFLSLQIHGTAQTTRALKKGVLTP